MYVDRVEFPNGYIIDEHHLIDFDHEAVMALVENDSGQILFVQVNRYPTLSNEWELPAGSIEAGETPVEAARREVLEEGGYHTSGHKVLYTYYPMNGIANQVFHIVYCRACQRAGEIDTNEISGVRWVSRTEIDLMIDEGNLDDGYSLTALLLWTRGKQE